MPEDSKRWCPISALMWVRPPLALFLIRYNTTNQRSYMKPILVFCADLQARESAYRSVKELKGDDIYALSQVVEYCYQQQVPLIMGGDQVDSPTISDEHTVEIRKQLLKIPAKNNWYVDGNHEKGFKRLSLEGGNAAAAHNLEGTRINIGPYSVTGYNWRTRRQWEALLEEQELVSSDILVLHGFASQVVPSLGLPPDEAPLCDMDLEWFDGKYKLVLMGDIHKEWEWTGPKGTRFMYSGSMWMHRLGEPEEKSFIAVNDDLTVTRVPLVCRPFIRADFISDSDVKSVKAWVKKAKTHSHIPSMITFMGGQLNRMHLNISSTITAEISAELEALKKEAFVFEKVDTSHDRDLTEVKGSLSEKLDLTTALSQLLDIKDSEQLQAMDFIKQAMEIGFEEAINHCKEKTGV